MLELLPGDIVEEVLNKESQTPSAGGLSIFTHSNGTGPVCIKEFIQGKWHNALELTHNSVLILGTSHRLCCASSLIHAGSEPSTSRHTVDFNM